MKEGTKMRITAIGGDILYRGHSQFLLRDSQQEMKPRRIKNIGMIAGGSGIAPMYQVRGLVFL